MILVTRWQRRDAAHPILSLLDTYSIKRRLACAGSLIERGADMNGRDKVGWMPLHKASQKGHFRFVKSLPEHGADVNAKQRR
jgi:ankyrin repeat protein